MTPISPTEDESRLNLPGQRSDVPQLVDPIAGSRIPYQFAPGTTLADTPVQLYLAEPGHHVRIQNNAATTVYVELDQLADAGSLALAAGAYYADDVEHAMISLYATATIAINGLASGGLVVISRR